MPYCVALYELTDGGNKSVGEEHGRCQVPVGGSRRVFEDGDAVLVGRQNFDQKLLEGRGVDAALAQKLLLQDLHVVSQLVLHRPLDAGENQSPEQQVDDIEEYEACEQQPRLAYGVHVCFLDRWLSMSEAAARRFPLCLFLSFFLGSAAAVWELLRGCPN